MDALLHDLRYGARSLVRMRGAAFVAVFTLALGIGSTTAIFSIVYAALLRPVPFDDPDRLVMLYTTRSTAREGVQRLRWSMTEITNLRSIRESAVDAGTSLRPTSGLEDLGSFTSTNVNLTSGDDPEQIGGEIVSPVT